MLSKESRSTSCTPGSIPPTPSGRLRERWAAEQHVAFPASSNDERFINRDELKYSLRSVWLYAPFVRHIYIVTVGHRPEWLDTDSGKVTIVPHREIFPNPGDL